MLQLVRGTCRQPADVVNGSSHVGKQLWVAVREAGNQCSNLCVARVGSHCCKQRVALKVALFWVARQWVKVIPCPNAVNTHCIGGSPSSAHFFHGCCLRPKLNTDFHVNPFRGGLNYLEKLLENGELTRRIWRVGQRSIKFC